MARMFTNQENLSRVDAVALLRAELLKITSSDVSICKVAAERGIFCKGFKRDGEGALRARYDWLDVRRPDMTREELEELANRWQLARQELHDVPLSCDVQVKEHDTCGGWDDFTEAELSRFILDLTKRHVTVV
jgi:hypothetical protein